jgi:hypothetical protein
LDRAEQFHHKILNDKRDEREMLKNNVERLRNRVRFLNKEVGKQRRVLGEDSRRRRTQFVSYFFNKQ